jgi:membrane protease YdiL (CAAX protease family)
LGVLAILGGGLLGGPIDEWVRWSGPGLLWGIAGGVAMLAILGLCQLVPAGPIRRLMQLVNERVKPLFRECRVVDLLLIAVLAGIGEELLFRGLLQGWTSAWLGGWLGDSTGPWLAVALTSLAFGFAHCISREYTVFATLLGFLLGALALLTGDLLAPIIAHALYDFVALLLLTRGDRNV